MKPATFLDRSRAWRRAGWVVRWLLVLVLAFDQLSSPLHHHHHDSDVDQDVALMVQDGADIASADDHLDPHEHDHRHLGHSVTALRSQAAWFDDGGTGASALPVLVAWTFVFPSPEPGTPAPVWREPGPPRFPSHRSLPPGAQAPPLHA